jgi:SAM-dependent methyltransferase
MIIHKLLAYGLAHGDNPEFYRLQARDAIRWLERQGVAFGPDTTVLDVGCGHGTFGLELVQRGCRVTFADAVESPPRMIPAGCFRFIDLDRDEVAALGQYAVVICSNVLEHLARPERFIAGIGRALLPHGRLYLSWTNWLSPWGGHEFSPFHYLGARRGHLVFDRLLRRPRRHTPFVNLFPTSIGRTLRWVRQRPELAVLATAPRYYPELAWLTRIPVLREFATWNCALLIGRVEPHRSRSGAVVENRTP